MGGARARRLERTPGAAGSPGTIAGIATPRIVIVCTGNSCRSPMAEGLLRDHLERAGVDAVVESCGTLGGRRGATGHGIDLCAARGIDIASHSSRTIAEAAIGDADLVIGMERMHCTQAIVDGGVPSERVFTLRDLVARAEASDARRAGESVAEWATRLAAGRLTSSLLGTGDDGIDDPVGGSRADYEATFALLDDLLERLVRRMTPAASPDAGRTDAEIWGLV